MPFQFPDLSGGGRHLSIANVNQIHTGAQTALANGTSGTAYNTSPTSPGISFIDSLGYYAPVWGSGDEAFTVAMALAFQAHSAASYLLSWGDPSDSAHGWACYANATETIAGSVHDTGAGTYLSSTTTGGVVNGSHLFHFEFRTGATREINIYVDNVLVAQTRAGPTGTPFVVTGNERLTPLVFYTMSTPSTPQFIADLAYWKRRLTNTERHNQLLALNAI